MLQHTGFVLRIQIASDFLGGSVKYTLDVTGREIEHFAYQLQGVAEDVFSGEYLPLGIVLVGGNKSFYILRLFNKRKSLGIYAWRAGCKTLHIGPEPMGFCHTSPILAKIIFNLVYRHILPASLSAKYCP